ncbi:N-formylglutamate amidohydrolase [Allohahella sp. A8]|uniref:N-formylglutamate amidohydrolase n=1 Tax=Allohahella sp. A8 TaxID=3141461 RepID=UPI003A7FF648
MGNSETSATNRDNWIIHRTGGPVLATAVHAGHTIREELQPYLAADDAELRREEDPLTDIWASAAPDHLICRTSRFEVDLNRSRDMALATRPENTWGKRIWRESPPQEMIERSLAQHDRFYALMRNWIEDLIRLHGKILLLDIHSYNHRRDGPYAPAASLASNPDIDLGLTELNHDRFGSLVGVFSETLSQVPCQGRNPDVRGNVRYPDGGNWPEWVFAEYGDDVCTITLEYKKFYMDEWSGHAYLPVVEDLRVGISQAIEAATQELKRCR